MVIEGFLVLLVAPLELEGSGGLGQRCGSHGPGNLGATVRHGVHDELEGLTVAALATVSGHADAVRVEGVAGMGSSNLQE